MGGVEEGGFAERHGGGVEMAFGAEDGFAGGAVGGDGVGHLDGTGKEEDANGDGSGGRRFAMRYRRGLACRCLIGIPEQYPVALYVQWVMWVISKHFISVPRPLIARDVGRASRRVACRHRNAMPEQENEVASSPWTAWRLRWEPTRQLTRHDSPGTPQLHFGRSSCTEEDGLC